MRQRRVRGGRVMRQRWAGGGLAVATLASTASAWGATYDVGPGQTYANIGDVPLASLGAGDELVIHWRAEPYREKFGISGQGTAANPLVVRGVPSAAGELPIIDGDGAVNRADAHNRGLITIQESAAYVVVENLELRNNDGPHGNPNNASAIYAHGDHLTFRGLDIHHNGNGFFTWIESSDVTVERCHIHDNGVVDSVYEHNIYTESRGIVFQYNLLAPLRSGAPGNNLKDRSYGTVIRYNYIEGGNRCLDLVEAEDGDWSSDHGTTYVYGNVLVKLEETGQSQVVHFGQDNGMTPRQRLYFFNNTVDSTRGGSTTLFFLNAPATADILNNVFLTSSSTFELIDPDDSSEAVLNLGTNWIQSGWTLGSSSATVNGTGNLSAGSDPGLTADYRPAAQSSPVVDAGAALPGALSSHPVAHEYVAAASERARDDAGNPDLGAYAWATGPVGTGGSGGTGGGGATGGAGTGGAGTGGASTCEAALSACGTDCVDLDTSTLHCGECNAPCATNATCSSGSCACEAGYRACANLCVADASAREECAGTCIDTDDDPNHCGDCNAACPVGASCQAGACTCGAGLDLCTGACVDLESAGAHCGSCGNACAAEQVCSLGECASECATGLTACGQDCVDTATDLFNCGACGDVCDFANAVSTCAAGTCSLASCQPGHYDLDADAANGCEYACIAAGDETCNGADDDCDGETDENPECQPSGTGGAGAGTGGSAGETPDSPDDSGGDEGGCGCRVAGDGGVPLGGLLLALAAAVGLIRRRHR